MYFVKMPQAIQDEAKDKESEKKVLKMLQIASIFNI